MLRHKATVKIGCSRSRTSLAWSLSEVFTSKNESDARVQGLINRSKREDRFKDEDDGSFGATMFAHNRLSEISFEYSDFPNVRTANPHLCVISDWEFHYIKDIARLCVFRK